MPSTSRTVTEDMRTQLIITMRKGLARRYARDRSLLDVAALLGHFTGARIIGRPGFSMRVSVKSAQVADLKRHLGQDFVVEHDLPLECFASGKR